MDVLAVFGAAERAVDRARRGEGPTLLECKTYRFRGHSRGDPCGYRSAEELQAWQQRDPLIGCRAWLTQEAGMTNDDLEEIENSADATIEAAVDFAVRSPDPVVGDVSGPVYAE
jgi:TPP-dependent pyruvate/acetoin dehydrogenase alpha subunit